MSGVEIIDKPGNYVLMIIFGVMFTGFITVAGYNIVDLLKGERIMGQESDRKDKVIQSLLAIVCIFCCLKSWSLCMRYDYTELRVLVNNKVRFNDFMKKYDIVKQEGKTYIVLERGKE